MKMEGTGNEKEDAISFVDILCNVNGEFVYPNEWKQCSENVYCGDPPSIDHANGTRTWIDSSEGEDVYGTQIHYSCVNGSQFDTNSDTVGDKLNRSIRCRWNKKWHPYHNELPACVITHCVDSFPIPSDAYMEEVTAEWTPINEQKIYECAEKLSDGNHTRFFETNRSITEFEMLCQPDGTFEFVNERQNWPTCLDTVFCGTPPAMENGSKLVWTNENKNGSEEYTTQIRYECINGSQFDTTDDAVGDSFYIYNKCKWNKTWAPYPSLPPCIITHCVDPFVPPDNTFMIESTPAWTPINTDKWFECSDKAVNGSHTRFFETDRSLSSFAMTCKPDGQFDFVDVRENWPTCLDTVHCGQPPSATEDGFMEWLNTEEQGANFSYYYDNYLAKIRYKCINGSQFSTNGDEYGDSISVEIQCLWNKQWDPWPELPKCYITHCVDPFDIPGMST